MSFQEDLLLQIQNGLQVTPMPYKAVAQKISSTESEVIHQIDLWIKEGNIKRWGVVVQHRELGYTSNAMCVWDIPNSQVKEMADKAIKYPFVTLCYQRRRSLPAWPYNFYCMIHGKSKEDALSKHKLLQDECGFKKYPYQVLMSTRQFKQKGARYAGFESEQIDMQIINELQHGISITERPFYSLSKKLGITEEEVVQRIQKMLSEKKLTRFGPMYNVEKMGGEFTLVAMSVPNEQFEEVCQYVNSFVEVAHNYEREHNWNMWFVLATESAAETKKILKEIEEHTGITCYSMPKLKEFFLELKFDLMKEKS